MTRAALAGATGLVGGSLLALLLEDPSVERVIAPTRRALAPDPRLDNPVGAAWPEGPRVDEAYCALGTTRKDAGSDAAFRAVDFDLVLAFAKAAKAAGARRFGLVSSLGADASSRLLYPRTKGEAEAAVAALGFESVVVVRPSLLLGARAKPRLAERVSEPLLKAVGPLLVGPARKYRAIEGRTVARALIRLTRDAKPGVSVVESDAVESAGR